MIRVAHLSAYYKHFRWRFPKKEPFNFEAWVKDHEWVWDSDNSGDNTAFWVVIDGDKVIYYRVKHEWWIEYNPEWEIHNQFEIAVIDKAAIDDKEARDNLRFVV